MLDALFVRFLQETKTLPQDGWTKGSTNQDIEIYMKPMEGSDLKATIGRGYADFPARLIAGLFNDLTCRKTWDTMYKAGRILETIDPWTVVVHHEFKAIWPTAAREVVAIQQVRELPDGAFALFGCSVEHPSCPPRSGFVRAEAVVGGCLITPVDGINRCKIDNVTFADPKGNLPAFVVNKVAVEQPLSVANVIKMAKSMDPRKYKDYMYVSPSRVNAAAQNVDADSSLISAPSLVTLAPVEMPSSELVASTANSPEDNREKMATEVEAIVSGSSAMQHGQLLLDPCMFNTKKIRESCIPSANGHFSARALAKFIAAIGTGGKLIGGRRILTQESALEISKVRAVEEHAVQNDIKWCLGVRRFSIMDSEGRERNTVWGHSGMGGSIAIYDPENDIAIAITVNKLTLDREFTRTVLNHIVQELGMGVLVDLD